MQEEKNRKPFSRKLLFSLLIFAVSFVLTLVLWIAIQNTYGKAVLQVASHVAAKVENVDFEMIKEKENGQLGAQFFLFRRGKGFSTIINFDFSLFTFNAPLTLAVMAALSLFIKNHIRAYAQGLLILIAIHFFYVFTSEAGRISYLLAQNKMESASEFGLFLWQYIWGFIDAMLVRFEPFLIGSYLFIRFSPSSFIVKKKKKG